MVFINVAIFFHKLIPNSLILEKIHHINSQNLIAHHFSNFHHSTAKLATNSAIFFTNHTAASIKNAQAQMIVNPTVFNESTNTFSAIFHALYSQINIFHATFFTVSHEPLHQPKNSDIAILLFSSNDCIIFENHSLALFQIFEHQSLN
jgi:hypothetical protein